MNLLQGFISESHYSFRDYEHLLPRKKLLLDRLGNLVEQECKDESLLFKEEEDEDDDSNLEVMS